MDDLTARPADAALPATAPASPCANCGAVLTGPWCAACGQKAGAARLSLKHLLHEIPHAVFHVDRGFVPTLKALVTRPGEVVDEYLRGKRVRYFNPLTLLVICAGVCGAAWALFPFRPELFWPLAPRIQDTPGGTLAPLFFKIVGATQLALLPLTAWVIYGVWAAAAQRALQQEGRAPSSPRITMLYLVGPGDARRLAQDPRYRMFGECMAAAAFVTALSLLVSAAFAPLAALATRPVHYAVLFGVAFLLSSLPALQLIRTSPLYRWNSLPEAVINALSFALATPCGFLFYLLTVQWSNELGAWLVRLFVGAR